MKKKLRLPGFLAQNAFAFCGFPANFSPKPEKSVINSVGFPYFSYLEYFGMHRRRFVDLFIFYAFDYYFAATICLFLYRLPFRRFEGMIAS
ncbi:hypothetical protein DXT91_17315 [Agrobacterium tumefaciens]|uniref:hypothetical protein n=2 Tax=Rhizobium/Agrobacterium group TaxID=227290 RepID=UPI0012B7EBBC|nr:hypothetical protein [Agrobacterium tumefaciens]MQB05871.1 hypothetical protein [Agrobacterium tumefaciens]